MRDNENSRSSANIALGGVAIVICALLLLYAVGYFYLGTRHNTVDARTGQPVVVRAFRTEWQALAYVPAALIENLLTGNGASASPE